MKTMYVLFALLLMLVCTIVFGNFISPSNKLDESFQQQMTNLKDNETQEISIPLEYDYLLVVPPYTSVKNLENLSLPHPVVESIIEGMTTEENFHFFVLENDSVIDMTVLPVSYSTEDDTIVLVKHPHKLKVTKDSHKPRPLVIMK